MKPLLKDASGMIVTHCPRCLTGCPCECCARWNTAHPVERSLHYDTLETTIARYEALKAKAAKWDQHEFDKRAWPCRSCKSNNVLPFGRDGYSCGSCGARYELDTKKPTPDNVVAAASDRARASEGVRPVSAGAHPPQTTPLFGIDTRPDGFKLAGVTAECFKAPDLKTVMRAMRKPPPTVYPVSPADYAAIQASVSESGPGLRAQGGDYTEPGEPIIYCDHGWDD